MRRLIVLRPEPGASETVARARRRGLKALAIPLFAIEPLDWTVPTGEFDGLLLTSANAVREAGAALHALRRLPVYAVGEQTAVAARGAGLSVAATGEAGVAGLLASLGSDLRLLHLSGEDRTETAGAAQRITAVPVYRSKACEPVDLGQAIGNVVLVHSTRAGRRLDELLDERASIAIAALSGAAAAAAGVGWEQVEIAERPSDAALLALAARLCNKTAA
ncbi:MAG TPA: uroporphyrinogen-III synthase [Sphingomicrobium sp.]